MGSPCGAQNEVHSPAGGKAEPQVFFLHSWTPSDIHPAGWRWGRGSTFQNLLPGDRFLDFIEQESLGDSSLVGLFRPESFPGSPVPIRNGRSSGGRRGFKLRCLREGCVVSVCRGGGEGFCGPYPVGRMR